METAIEFLKENTSLYHRVGKNFSGEIAKAMEEYAALQTTPPSDEEIDHIAEEYATPLARDHEHKCHWGGIKNYWKDGFKQGVQYRDTTLEKQVKELIEVTGCSDLNEVVEKFKEVDNSKIDQMYNDFENTSEYYDCFNTLDENSNRAFYFEGAKSVIDLLTKTAPRQ